VTVGPQHQVINSFRTQFAAVIVGTCLVFFYVIMPLVLGAAAETRGIDDQQLGFIAGIFMLGMFFVTASGVFWIRRVRWRRTLWICALVAAVGYAIPIVSTSYPVLLLSMAVCGIACGAGYSITIACLGDSRVPERGFGMTWGMQNGLGMLLSFAIPRFTNTNNVLPATLGILVALALLALFLIPWMPDHGVKGLDSDTPESSSKAPNMLPVVIVGLGVIFLVFLAESSIWAYLERIAVGNGMTRELAGTAIAASLFAGTCSSFIAAAIGNRLGRMIPMTIAIVASLFSVFLFQVGDGVFLFFVAVIIYGAAWNFGAPSRMALVAEADIEGRYVPAITSLQTLGSAIGPTIAGLLVAQGSYSWVYLIAALAWLVAWVLFYWANRQFNRYKNARANDQVEALI
jgi:predicted MFS family arabinose efflux permease